jgi:hypothetical protein
LGLAERILAFVSLIVPWRWRSANTAPPRRTNERAARS